MMTSRYIDPTTDFGFKRLFGEEDSKEILKAFLDAILELSHPIADLSYIPTEQRPASADERGGIYDIYAFDTAGRRFVVSMQHRQSIYVREQSLYAATFPIIERGESPYPDRQWPIYVIAVLNFRLDNDPRHRRRIQLCDTATGQPFYTGLTFVYIELPKFQTALDPALSIADKWVYMLRYLSGLMDIPTELDQTPFTEVFARAEEAALSPAERERYERSRKDTLDEQGRIMTAHQEGAIKQAMAIARQMLAEGEERAKIARYTGLSLEDVAQLAADTTAG